jgi:hypothetical protein
MAVRASEAARERRWAEIERRKAEREAYRKRQAERRAEIKAAAKRRRSDLERARELCKVNASAAREVADAVYKRDRAALLRRRQQTKQDARTGCRGSKAQIRADARRLIDERRRLAAEDRKLRAEIARAERAARKREKPRSTASERRSESDDLVRQNIAPEDQALWRRVKGKLRATGHMSRTEAFEQYKHDNPREALRARQDSADRAVRRDVADYYRQERARRRTG